MANSKWLCIRYLVFALVTLGLGVGVAQEPTVTWTASTMGEGLPDTLDAGYNVFALENDGKSNHSLFVFRLKEGTTVEAFQVASDELDRSFTGDADPVEALNNALELVDPMGEVIVPVGMSNSFGTVLEPGDYLLEVDVETEGMPEKSFHSFTVSGDAGMAAPEPDVTIQLVDFAFALPPDIGAGEQTWQVTNVGEQLHHMVLFKLQEGKTVDDLMAWMQTEQGAPPAEEAGGVGIVNPGRSVYAPMNLEAGDYVAICFMPDHRGDATGQPHFMLGMMQSFTVAGE